MSTQKIKSQPIKALLVIIGLVASTLVAVSVVASSGSGQDSQTRTLPEAIINLIYGGSLGQPSVRVTITPIDCEEGATEDTREMTIPGATGDPDAPGNREVDVGGIWDLSGVEVTADCDYQFEAMLPDDVTNSECFVYWEILRRQGEGNVRFGLTENTDRIFNTIILRSLDTIPNNIGITSPVNDKDGLIFLRTEHGRRAFALEDGNAMSLGFHGDQVRQLYINAMGDVCPTDSQSNPETFVPNVDIDLERTDGSAYTGDQLAGVEIVLSFTSTNDNCPPFHRATYVVGSSGDVALKTGFRTPTLYHTAYPVGVQYDPNIDYTDMCSYTVNWPSTVGDSTLVLQSGSTDTVSGGAGATPTTPTASASYRTQIAPPPPATTTTMPPPATTTTMPPPDTTMPPPAPATSSLPRPPADPNAIGFPNVILENVHMLSTGESADSQSEQVRVSFVPLSGCDAGARIPSQNSYVLDAGSQELTGFLSTNCNWQVNFVHAAGVCPVTATVKDLDDDPIGSDVSGKLTLSGVSSGTALRYFDQNVESLEFDISDTGCASSFSPEATITVPATPVSANGNNGFAGLEITVNYDSEKNGCTAEASATYVVGEDGTVDLASDETTPTLIHQALTDLGKTPVSENRCNYDVSFTNEVGSLRIASGATREVNGGSEATPDDDVGVTASYAFIMVDVEVSVNFPSDRVYSTEDKVSVSVTLLSPCGSVFAFFPSGLSARGNLASVQALPGPQVVYGSKVNRVLVGEPRVYTVPAYADTRGMSPCTVRVTETEVPESCETTTDRRATQSYTVGARRLSFSFDHTCGSDSTATGTPPAPPSTDTAGPQPDRPTS